MKSVRSPLILLAGLLASEPVLAQQGGVTILRGQSSDQPAPSAPDTGVRRVPVERPAAAAPTMPASRSSATPLPIDKDGPSGNMLPPPPQSDMAQAIASSKPLTDAEAAAFAAALKAIDEGRYGDARPMVANFRNPLLSRYVDWNILRVAPKTDADFASTWRFLRDNPDWPEPEVLRRQAEDRIAPDTPAGDVVRYFTAFPPLTSAGHMRRLEAAQAASPNDVQKFASDSWQNATFRTVRRERFPQSLRPAPERPGSHRAVRPHPARGPPAGRARAAAQAAARLPAARQCAPGDGHARGRCADRAARRLGGAAGRARDQAGAGAVAAPHRQPR